MHAPKNSNLAMSLQILSSDGWRLWAEPENMIIEEHEVCQRHHSSCWSRRRVSGLKFLARWWMKLEMFCSFRYISRRSTKILGQIKCKDELERDGASTGPHRVSGAPRNFFSGGGVNKFSWGQRTERTGIWGRSPLVKGSGGSCNLVQEISFHIVKFS